MSPLGTVAFVHVIASTDRATVSNQDQIEDHPSLQRLCHSIDRNLCSVLVRVASGFFILSQTVRIPSSLRNAAFLAIAMFIGERLLPLFRCWRF